MMAVRKLSVWVSLVISSIIATSVTHSVLGSPITTTIDPVEVDKNDIKIYFYNQENTFNGTQVDITDEEAVQNTSFSNTKQSFFIVHGWSNNVNSDMCTSIRNALLALHDVNVFVVDWSSYSEKAYMEAFLQVSNIGKTLANMIRVLEANNGLNLGKTAIVGHSLGAHIAGVAGTALDSECEYIVGMDPAGPLFQLNVTSNRITPSSAQFVQIIHTSGSQLGMYEPLGHADYYPNGGKEQNGCSSDDYGACSHGRSYMYYAESIVSGQFIAQKCDSYTEFENGTCVGITSWLGGYSVDTSAIGSYYLDTNAESPFTKTY